jgi:hypothetical protein
MSGTNLVGFRSVHGAYTCLRAMQQKSSQYLEGGHMTVDDNQQGAGDHAIFDLLSVPSPSRICAMFSEDQILNPAVPTIACVVADEMKRAQHERNRTKTTRGL